MYADLCDIWVPSECLPNPLQSHWLAHSICLMFLHQGHDSSFLQHLFPWDKITIISIGFGKWFVIVLYAASSVSSDRLWLDKCLISKIFCLDEDLFAVISSIQQLWLLLFKLTNDRLRVISVHAVIGYFQKYVVFLSDVSLKTWMSLTISLL